MPVRRETLRRREALRRSNSFLRIGEKPFDSTARSAGERRRGPIRPVEVKKRQAGCVQLRPPLDKMIVCTVRTAHGLTSDDIALPGRSLTHRFKPSSDSREELAHWLLQV